jgi:hypothetical protein
VWRWLRDAAVAVVVPLWYLSAGGIRPTVIEDPANRINRIKAP